MKILQSGQFYGSTNATVSLGNLVLTDTEYTREKVDWHYHENAYFTLIIAGFVIEGNKKEVHECSAGTLLFHHWQEPHYNIKPPGYTRGFHIEIPERWFSEFAMKPADFQGNTNVSDPEVKLLLYQLFKETKLSTGKDPLFFECLLVKAFSAMLSGKSASGNKPNWVRKLDMLLHDELDSPYSLVKLAGILDIHPVHLSRDFSKYFHCNLGEYVRKLRIEKSCTLLPQESISLTEIAYACGFSDQSHFTRSFRHIQGINPSVYRKLIKH